MRLHLEGQPDAIIDEVLQRCPMARDAMERSRRIPAQLLPYQAAAIFMLACGRGGPMLDIGTFKGYSASLLAQASPASQVVTLNPSQAEAFEAMDNLASWSKVTVVVTTSCDFMRRYPLSCFGLVFVDGDHKRAERDLPWFDRLLPGGLLLFHDAENACVARAIEVLGASVGRGPDVLIADDSGVSMAGFYRDGRNG